MPTTTNKTPHYGLPQYLANDVISYLQDVNPAYAEIDTQLYTANSNATGALTAASTAQNTADNANKSIATLQPIVTKNTNDIATVQALTTSIGNSITQINEVLQVIGAVSATKYQTMNITTTDTSQSETITLTEGDYVIITEAIFRTTATTANPFAYLVIGTKIDNAVIGEVELPSPTISSTNAQCTSIMHVGKNAVNIAGFARSSIYNTASIRTLVIKIK